MQINKIEHQVDDDMQLQEIVIEAVVNNLKDIDMLQDLIETYRNEYDLLEDRSFKIELDKVLICHLRPEL